jgi:putative flavoprotein involved in K+ transport
VWWLVQCGFLDQPVTALPSPADRLTANVQNSGARGGHDLNYRVLRAAGVQLVGRFLGAVGDELRFAPDLGASVAWGDERYRMLVALIRRHAAETGIPAPDMAEPEPFDGQAAEWLPLDRFRSVLYAGGYRPAYRALVPWADTFDDLGFPIHVDGESTAVPGLHFIGVHFLRTRKSSLLLGVGEDAAVVADRIAAG